MEGGWSGCALLELLEQLSRPPARGDYAIIIVEDDDDLAAFLDKHPATLRLNAESGRRLRMAAAEYFHLFFTTPTPMNPA